MTDQTSLTIDHAGTAAAWTFWMGYFRQRQGKFPGFDVRKATKKDVLGLGNGDECPFCHGTEIIKFRETVRTTNYNLDAVLCVCCLMRVTAGSRDEESPWQSKTVAELKELDIPKGSAGFTKIIKQETARFIRDLGIWVYLSGTYGCGKTALAYAVKSNLRGISTYVNVADLSDKIYEATGKHTLNDLTDSLIGIPVLIVDDLGAEHSTDYLYSVLYKVINGRYARGFDRPTYITSNLPIGELKVSTVDNLRRIASRLSDNELVVELVSKQADYRGMKK